MLKSSVNEKIKATVILVQLFLLSCSAASNTGLAQTSPPPPDEPAALNDLLRDRYGDAGNQGKGVDIDFVIVVGKDAAGARFLFESRTPSKHPTGAGQSSTNYDGSVPACAVQNLIKVVSWDPHYWHWCNETATINGIAYEAKLSWYYYSQSKFNYVASKYYDCQNVEDLGIMPVEVRNLRCP